jgi:hypothetical protein
MYSAVKQSNRVLGVTGGLCRYIRIGTSLKTSHPVSGNDPSRPFVVLSLAARVLVSIKSACTSRAQIINAIVHINSHESGDSSSDIASDSEH